MPRLLRRFLILLSVVVVLGIGGFVVWASLTPAPMPEALAALKSDDRVHVETTPWLTFRPVKGRVNTGLVLYPGGRVDARSYAPAARALAEQGYLVVIPSMPLNLAVLAPDRAWDVIQAHPEVTEWAVGGHSLGGVMATRAALAHPDKVHGLVLWAAYPAKGDDLSRSKIHVTSIFGTQDGLTTTDEIDAARLQLPLNTTAYIPITGGNHAQFGWYGPQAGDNTAGISREEQQKRIVAGTSALLTSLTAFGQ